MLPSPLPPHFATAASHRAWQLVAAVPELDETTEPDDEQLPELPDDALEVGVPELAPEELFDPPDEEPPDEVVVVVVVVVEERVSTPELSTGSPQEFLFAEQAKPSETSPSAAAGSPIRVKSCLRLDEEEERAADVEENRPMKDVVA